MPSFIVKPKSDEDFYVEYSTVVDAPVRWGDRAAFQAAHDRLVAQQVRDDRYTAERFGRADEHGSSAHEFDGRDRWGQPLRLAWYWWDDTEFTIMEGPGGPGTIAREHLRTYCEAWASSAEAAAAMVKPFRDEEDRDGASDHGHGGQREGSAADDPGAEARAGAGDRQ